MQNIFIDRGKVEQIILALEEDNVKIDEIVKNIQSEIKKLDNNVWQSSEKNKLDEKYESYFKKIEYGLSPYLKECSDILKTAVFQYNEANQGLLDDSVYLDDGTMDGNI